jgi:hypothetical protein
MQPLLLSKDALAMNGQYISADRLAGSLRRIGEPAMRQFLRLWVAEGIPFAFRESPLVYEAAREWLSQRLEVAAEDIRLVGSAKIGYSLSPSPKFGQPFGPASDLDFVAVSEPLFSRLQLEVNQWQDDYDQGLVKPANLREAKFWADSLKDFPKWLRRGYITPSFIPARYSTTNRIINSSVLLATKLLKTPNAPAACKISLRVYRDDGAFHNQMLVNLLNTKASLFSAAG